MAIYQFNTPLNCFCSFMFVQLCVLFVMTCLCLMFCYTAPEPLFAKLRLKKTHLKGHPGKIKQKSKTFI